MKEIRDAGTTILFVSHAIEQVKRFCTRAIWIERGVIRADGDANDIVNMYEDYLYSNINLVNEQQSSSVEQNVAATLLETRANGESDTQEPKGVPLTQEILQSEPRQVDMLGRILSVKCLTPHIRTFQSLVATVEYEIYDDVPNLLIGVAIYDRQRKYIFGPNTYLDNFKIPTAKGKYSITYTIPQLPLLSGTYFLDAGLFSEKGLVVLDYKTAAQEFIVRNDYFTEGLVYIQHEWRLGK
jgi:teichoic acid transport system ATP-binding protein